MKKETDYEELLNKKITNTKENLDSEKQQPKKLGGLRIIEVGLLVLVVILSANLFLSSRKVKAATTNRAPSPISQNESDVYTQYPEEEAKLDSRQDPLAQLGLDYYLSKYGEGVDPADVRAIAENFGCHMEVHIYKSDELVMRLSYFNGQVYEI